MQKLTTTFAEEHLKDMYGAKEDANDEDFFPYVSNTLNSPSFLMWKNSAKIYDKYLK